MGTITTKLDPRIDGADLTGPIATDFHAFSHAMKEIGDHIEWTLSVVNDNRSTFTMDYVCDEIDETWNYIKFTIKFNFPATSTIPEQIDTVIVTPHEGDLHDAIIRYLTGGWEIGDDNLLDPDRFPPIDGDSGSPEDVCLHDNLRREESLPNDVRVCVECSEIVCVPAFAR